MRTIIDFNQDWHFSKEVSKVGVFPVSSEPVTLPHTWNAQDGQDGGNDYFRGTCVYGKKFEKPLIKNTQKVFLEFEAAAMTADVYLNGRHLAHHEGGYSAFCTELTDALEQENDLLVYVDNGINDSVYPQKADFTFYGGIYRDVKLILVPEEHFELVKDGTPGIKVTPVAENGCARVTVESWQNFSGPVTYTVLAPKGCGLEFWHGESPLQSAEVVGRAVAESRDGYACAEIMIGNPRLWDGKTDPYLYVLQASIKEGEDTVSARFGCREFSVDSEAGFVLNGKPCPLRGVSRHQDRADVGNALTKEMQEEDMQIALEIGANTLRLAHYQQSQYFYDLCDEAGMAVWAEIPYITQHMPGGRENTISQMKELITQCYNHPSIICWGLSNEISASGAVTEDMMENHRILNDLCHEMDSTRPTTMAHVFMLETDSPIVQLPDIGSYNLYFGWYLGELAQNDSFFEEYHRKYPNRAIGFSEYGADANPQYHASKPERGDYTEEYQCVYHEHLLKMIEEHPYLWATHVWNLFDFAADGREEGGKKGVNQKGLVTIDRKIKKDAFYLYKATWSVEPFVHICGRRYVDRAETTTQIKVYSNCGSVALYVDGKLMEKQEGRRIFTFNVPLTGEHTIMAVSGSVSESIAVRKVEEPNRDYLFLKTEVVNWFDKMEYRPECYSIKDTMGTLSQDPRTAGILKEMMDKMAATRGDVAKSANQNANLQKMMAGMSMESLIKQAGDSVPPELVQKLNSALQLIRKTAAL